MLYSLSIYLARLTLGSIGVTNKGATTIMAWLNKIAAIVGIPIILMILQIAHTNSPVCWVTPLGLPVVQPYRKENVYHISTAMQDVQVKVNKYDYKCMFIIVIFFLYCLEDKVLLFHQTLYNHMMMLIVGSFSGQYSYDDDLVSM